MFSNTGIELLHVYCFKCFIELSTSSIYIYVWSDRELYLFDLVCVFVYQKVCFAYICSFCFIIQYTLVLLTLLSIHFLVLKWYTKRMEEAGWQKHMICFFVLYLVANSIPFGWHTNLAKSCHWSTARLWSVGGALCFFCISTTNDGKTQPVNCRFLMGTHYDLYIDWYSGKLLRHTSCQGCHFNKTRRLDYGFLQHFPAFPMPSRPLDLASGDLNLPFSPSSSALNKGVLNM